jgi:hypothetical protein
MNIYSSYNVSHISEHVTCTQLTVGIVWAFYEMIDKLKQKPSRRTTTSDLSASITHHITNPSGSKTQPTEVDGVKYFILCRTAKQLSGF